MNNRNFRVAYPLRRARALIALMACSLAAAGAAQAANPLGLYIGAAYGQAHIRAQLGGLIPGSTGPLADFDATHSAYQAMLGIRPISLVGAEITYMDFGQQSRRGLGEQVPGLPGVYATADQVSQKGEAAYALLYLPVPIIDVYLKAGISRMTSDMSVTYAIAGAGTCAIGQPNCNVSSVARSSTDTGFAYGAGLQWKLGNWAVRGEYERLDAAGANPTLLSIGMIYWLP